MCRTSLPRLLWSAGVALISVVTAHGALAEPRVSLDKPIENSLHSGTRFLDVEGLVSDPDGLRSISILLNNRALTEEGQRGIELRERIRKTLDNLQGVKHFPIKFRIPADKLKDGSNSVTLRAESIRGEISVARRSFVHSVPKGTIYVAAIGINRYQDSAVPPLKYAEADAMAVAAYFREQLGVPPENIFTLVGARATAQNIKRLLGITLRRKAGPHDQIVIYYAGHGVPEFDNTLAKGDQVEKYLLPWDGEIDGLYATALPMREVDYLSRRFVSERVVFVLDTCFSGSASGQSARARTLPARAGLRSFGHRLDDGFLQRMAEAKGKVILTASGVNEPSHEIDELGHGAFTYHLLEGLKGQADLDRDGIVGVLEVYKYLNKKVPAQTGYNQTPAYFVNETMEGDIILGRTESGSYQFEMSDPWAGAGNDGRLVIQTDPPDATVFINGASRLTRRGFINTTLAAGSHRIKVEMPGYKTVELEQPIGRHRTSELRVSLEPDAPRRLLRGPPPPP